MANIKITVDGPLEDGHKITFKAPCGCSDVGKLNVFYIDGDTQKNRLFTLKDANNNDLSGEKNMFAYGVYVSVVLDTNRGFAYVQNAASSAKIEKYLGILRTTLVSGEGGVGFIDDRITENTVFSFYTSIYGVNPKSVTVSKGSVALTFEPQGTDMEVGVRIDG